MNYLPLKIIINLKKGHKMKKAYLKIDPWRIIEENFDPKKVKTSESIFSLGN